MTICIRPHGSRTPLNTVKFSGESTTNWLLHGVTIRDPEDNNSIGGGCSAITWNYCVIENCLVYSLRIRRATNVTVQQCVIRNARNELFNLGGGDSTGIQVRPLGPHVGGIKILDNEIFNCGDCIQLTPNDTHESTVEALIEGNDLYFDGAYYIGATNEMWQENALDIKVGSLATRPRGSATIGCGVPDGTPRAEPSVNSSLSRSTPGTLTSRAISSGTLPTV